ncbi:MAG: histidine phosphatase family protein [Paracoccaceae bacterium]
MSLRLILTRHAKSGWDHARNDQSRPLSKSGERAATAIGQWLVRNRHLPDRVLCSNATRTSQTWLRIAAELPAAPHVDFRQSLYLGSADSMYQELLCVKGAPVLMLVAHNPGIAVLARALCAGAPPHRRFDDYPAGSTTVLDFENGDWSALRQDTGQVVDFVIPQELGPRHRSGAANEKAPGKPDA